MINKKSSKEMANNNTKIVAGLVVTFQRESLNSSISQEYWIKECKKEKIITHFSLQDWVSNVCLDSQDTQRIGKREVFMKAIICRRRCWRGWCRRPRLRREL